VELPLEQELKVPLTAAVLIPPEAVWEPIQSIRRTHDPQFLRWMPHVTLLYPFVPAARLAEAADLLRPAAAAVAPFEIALGGFGKFTHSAQSVTLWLRLDPIEPLAALQARLEQAMPWCDDVSSFFGGFTPHVSVGRFQSVADADRVAGRIAATWQPLAFQVAEVALIARSGAPAEPFRVEQVVPLGAGASPDTATAPPPAGGAA